jgi:hypothetical protein
MSKSLTYKCGSCGILGHNSRKCPQDDIITLSEQETEQETEEVLTESAVLAEQKSFIIDIFKHYAGKFDKGETDDEYYLVIVDARYWFVIETSSLSRTNVYKALHKRFNGSSIMTYSNSDLEDIDFNDVLSVDIDNHNEYQVRMWKNQEKKNQENYINDAMSIISMDTIKRKRKRKLRDFKKKLAIDLKEEVDERFKKFKEDLQDEMSQKEQNKTLEYEKTLNFIF